MSSGPKSLSFPRGKLVKRAGGEQSGPTASPLMSSSNGRLDATGNDTSGQRSRNSSVQAGFDRQKPLAADDHEHIVATIVDGPISLDGRSLYESLVAFGAQCSQQAALQIPYSHAEQQMERARVEYERQRHRFDAYPAIEERLAGRRDAAQRELDTTGRLLDEHAGKARNIVEILTTLIGQTVEDCSRKWLSAKRTDVISRAEFDEMRASYSRLEEETKASNHKVDKLQADLRSAKKQLKDTEDGMHKASSLAGQLSPMQSQLAANSKTLNEMEYVLRASERDIMDLKKIDLKLFSTKADHAGLKESCKKLENDIVEIRKVNAASVAKNMVLPVGSGGLDASFGEEFDLSEEKMETLEQFTRGEEEEEVSQDPAETYNATSCLSRKVHSIHKAIGLAVSEIQALKASTHEEGKDSVVKRLENLDRIVNNLASKTSNVGDGDAIMRRIAQLEQDQSATHRGLEDLRTTSPQPAATADDLKKNSLATVNTRVDQLEVSIKVLESTTTDLSEQQDTKDEMVAATLEVQESAFKAAMERIESTVGALRTDMASIVSRPVFDEAQKAIRQTTDSLSTRFNEIRQQIFGELRELQASLDRMKARPTSHTPPAMQQNFPRFDDAPPPVQMQNGRAQSAANSARAAMPSQHGNGVTAHQALTPIHTNVSLLNAQPLPGDNFLVQQIDATKRAVQHLKQRMDNQITDDLSAKMVDQMSKMYPHAKNAEKAVQDALAQYNSLKNEKDADIRDLHTKIDEAAMAAGSAQSLAQAADQLSRGLASRIGELNVEQTIKELAESVQKADEHEAQLRRGERALANLRDDVEILKSHDREHGGAIEMFKRHFEARGEEMAGPPE